MTSEFARAARGTEFMEGFGNRKDKEVTRRRRAGEGEDYKGQWNLSVAKKQGKDEPYERDAGAQGTKGIGDEFEFC
jgi:hypothetical protein